jgi:hypothetical protein
LDEDRYNIGGDTSLLEVILVVVVVDAALLVDLT